MLLPPEMGKDYPSNWNEFLDRFGTQEACPVIPGGMAVAAGFHLSRLRRGSRALSAESHSPNVPQLQPLNDGDRRHDI